MPPKLLIAIISAKRMNLQCGWLGNILESDSKLAHGGMTPPFMHIAHMPSEKFPIQWMEILTITFFSSSSRYWVVFSVHDDTIPFLELWTEPTEVASKPPQFMFPLAVCQHISPSLVPAGDHEWTFVVNFETVAIRFSCNSR